VLLFIPEEEGTKVTTTDMHQDIRDLLQGGLSLADVVIPKTRDGLYLLASHAPQKITKEIQ